jgi:hypothetical protein
VTPRKEVDGMESEWLKILTHLLVATMSKTLLGLTSIVEFNISMAGE